MHRPIDELHTELLGDVRNLREATSRMIRAWCTDEWSTAWGDQMAAATVLCAKVEQLIESGWPW